MTYCKIALSLSGDEIDISFCGKDCPIFPKCPRLIIENARDEAEINMDKAVVEAMKETVEIFKKEKDGMIKAKLEVVNGS